jgi:HAD superfamily hydrolase (TIGR01509 family)
VKRAVLFDLDGVLLETEPLKARAHSAAVAHFGGDVPPQFYSRVMGTEHAIVRAAFLAEAGIPSEPAEYSRVFREHYEALIENEATMCAGANELLSRLRETGYAIALVTSSARWQLDPLLAKLFLPGSFDVLVSGDDVLRHKPAPDCYLRALELLRPDRALAFEDTIAGVAAATAAGLPVIGIRHALNTEHDLRPAAHVFSGLQDTATVLATLHGMLSWR